MDETDALWTGRTCALKRTGRIICALDGADLHALDGADHMRSEGGHLRALDGADYRWIHKQDWL
jgi:hypothetical protein